MNMNTFPRRVEDSGPGRARLIQYDLVLKPYKWAAGHLACMWLWGG
jgi:hypothetical protein